MDCKSGGQGLTHGCDKVKDYSPVLLSPNLCRLTGTQLTLVCIEWTNINTHERSADHLFNWRRPDGWWHGTDVAN